MSTTADVKAAEKKLQATLEAIKEASAHEKLDLAEELLKVSDEYAAALRELGSPASK